MLNISTIRDNLYKSRFVNELEYLKKKIQKDKEEEEDEVYTTTRVDKLATIIENLEKLSKEKQNKNKFDGINELVYHMPWNKLPSFHKLNRITLFLKQKELDIDNQKELIKRATQLIETNKLPAKNVTYDSVKAVITSISNLEINSEIDLYEFT